MLVLARKVGQEICIGENIKVTVVRIRKDQVRLGFTAPRAINIARKEITSESGREESTRGNS